MAITVSGSTGVSTTAAARGTTTTSVAFPTGVAVNRIAVITGHVKPSTATWGTAPSGFTLINEGTGGTGTNAADTGTARIGKWFKVLDGTETGSVTVTAATSPSCVEATMEILQTTLSGFATPIGVVAADTTHGTNPTGASGTWASAIGVGDYIHAGYGADTDATNAASAHALSQSGTTFGTITALSRVGNSSGNQGSTFTWGGLVSAVGGTAATTASMTWAASSCGAFALTRIREISNTSLYTSDFSGSYDTTEFGGNSYGTITQTAGEVRVDCSTTYAGLYSRNVYTFDSIYAKVTPAASNGATTEAYTAFWLDTQTEAAGTTIGMYYDAINNQIYFSNWTTYSDADGETILTYDPVAMAYWGLFRNGANIEWRTSPNGTTWTVRRTRAMPTWLSGSNALAYWLECHRAQGTANYAAMDNLNIAPAVDLNLTAGAFPASAGAGRAASAIDIATAAKNQPIVSGTGSAAFAGNSATNASAGPVLEAAGRAALVMDSATAASAQGIAVGTGRALAALDNATAAKNQPTIVAAGKANLGIELGTTAKNQPIVGAAGRASLVIDANADADPQPVIGTAGRAALVMDNVTSAKAGGAVSMGSRWTLQIDMATAVKNQPVIAGTSDATAGLDHATAAKSFSVPVGTGRAALVVDMATAVKSAPTAVSAGAASLVMVRLDTVRSATVYAAPGGISTELLGPDAENVELTAGAGAGGAVIGSRWTLVIDSVTNVKSAPMLAGAGRALLARDIATAVKPMSIVAGAGRSASAIEHTTTVRSASAYAGTGAALLRSDMATLVRAAAIMAGTSKQTTAISHSTSVKPMPVISGSSRWVLDIVVVGSAFTVWNGSVELPLTLEGVWDGTQIVPVTLDGIID